MVSGHTLCLISVFASVNLLELVICIYSHLLRKICLVKCHYTLSDYERTCPTCLSALECLEIFVPKLRYVSRFSCLTADGTYDGANRIIVEVIVSEGPE